MSKKIKSKASKSSVRPVQSKLSTTKLLIAIILGLLAVGYFEYQSLAKKSTINVIDPGCDSNQYWNNTTKKCTKNNPTPVATTKPPARQTPKPTRPPVQKRIPNQKAI